MLKLRWKILKQTQTKSNVANMAEILKAFWTISNTFDGSKGTEPNTIKESCFTDTG